MRGLRHGPYRPDLVMLDDIENDENVRSKEQRDKVEAWVKKVVLPLGPPDGTMDVLYPAFFEAAARLRALGHEVENPADNPVPPCKTWRGYMRMAIRQLVTCDCVALLPGWEESRGARVERRLSNDLELPAVPLAEMEQILRSTTPEELVRWLETATAQEHLA